MEHSFRDRKRLCVQRIYFNFTFACQFRQSFGNVISPRNAELKALIVHLTTEGFAQVAEYCREAKIRNLHEMQYAVSPTKFYCQLPCGFSTDPAF